MANKLLASLPPLPARMRALPVDARGYPVPWFVAWLDARGRGVHRGQGAPDFRVVEPAALLTAVSSKLCWICGQKRTTLGAFLVGPMCAVNRVSSEPPSHITCAEFTARACPFLVTPQRKRRESNMPPGWVDAAGVMIRRNPGVSLMWVTREFSLVDDGEGRTLFEIGEPEEIRWYAEGRTATRAEVLESFQTGLSILAVEARDDSERASLSDAVSKAVQYLPAAEAFG